MSSENITLAVELLILLLTIAAAVGVLARKLRLPYTVGLVIMGSLILIASDRFRGLEDSFPVFGEVLHVLDQALNFNDEAVRALIMGILVPPLIFEAAFHLHLKDVRENLRPILLFAIPGVILTTFLVGWVVTLGTAIAFPAALVFGALIAATDPVAVVALFRSLGVPKRLAVLLEGESLLNDGTAIVVFGIALAVSKGGSFSLLGGVIDFFVIAGGGLVIGIVLGYALSKLISRIDDYLVETAMTFILAYGSYTLAESLHVSGVLAIVAAGLTIGNLGPQGMSPTTRFVVRNFWEFTSFVANSLVFLLIGMVVDLGLLYANLVPIGFAIMAVLVARAIVIYGFSAISRDVPLKWQVILHWGGLRGAISLALALVLGANSELRAMAFGVVFFTLLVQGLSMGPIVKRLELAQRDPARDKYDLDQARAVAMQAALHNLEEKRRSGMISDQTWQIVHDLLTREKQTLRARQHDALQANPQVAAEELDMVWREALKVQRSTLIDLFTQGSISETLLEDLVTNIDAARTQDQIGWTTIDDLRQNLEPEE